MVVNVPLNRAPDRLLSIPDAAARMSIGRILGHTNVATTAHYARSEEPARREALERLGRAVAS